MEESPTSSAFDPKLVTYTHVLYGLLAFSILTSALSAATGLYAAAIVGGRFVFGWPSIMAVILIYARLRKVRGTWLETHFRWQLVTFWVSAVLIVCFSPLVFTIFLIPYVIGLFAVVGIWATYRVGRGWLALRGGQTLPLRSI